MKRKSYVNARFLLSENERFGLVFVKTGSINSGTAVNFFSLLVEDGFHAIHSVVGVPPVTGVHAVQSWHLIAASINFLLASHLLLESFFSFILVTIVDRVLNIAGISSIVGFHVIVDFSVIVGFPAVLVALVLLATLLLLAFLLLIVSHLLLLFLLLLSFLCTVLQASMLVLAVLVEGGSLMLLCIPLLCAWAILYKCH